MKSALDKYYTDPLIANKCTQAFKSIMHVHPTKDFIIEPSAGNGSFIKPIQGICKNSLFIDIAPDNSLIRRADFLKMDIPTYKAKYRKTYVLGNPPFGFKSSSAIKFIKKACTFCDAFGFILSRSFGKPSMQASVPRNFHLKYSKILPAHSFSVDRPIPCVFQIWEKQNKLRKNRPILKPQGYKFVHHQKDADFVIRRNGSLAGTVYTQDAHSKPRNKYNNYYIKLDNRSDVPKIRGIHHIPSKTKFQVLGPLNISKQVMIKYINAHLKK
jgi:predicted RNA methylase